MNQLADLIERIENLTEGSPEVDGEVWLLFGAEELRLNRAFTFSVDAVNNLARKVLPLWWISSGQCKLGPHASCGPDGRAFEAAGVPYPEQFDSGFHVDFGHEAPEACARLAALLKALEPARPLEAREG